jgi:hypothetical protein
MRLPSNNAFERSVTGGGAPLAWGIILRLRRAACGIVRLLNAGVRRLALPAHSATARGRGGPAPVEAAVTYALLRRERAWRPRGRRHAFGCSA